MKMNSLACAVLILTAAVAVAEDKPCSKYWVPMSPEATRVFQGDWRKLPLPPGLEKEPQPQAKVVYEGNLAKFSFNGELCDPEIVMEYIDDESKWSANAIVHFRDAGSHLFRIRTGTWHLQDGGPYDFSGLDSQARRILAIDPKARLELIIRFEMPAFCKAHPEETIRYGVPGKVACNSDDHNGFPLRGSPASKRYREEVVRILNGLAAHVNAAPWGKRVMLVRPCWGVYTEWHFYGFWNSPGVCAPMQEAFRSWKNGKWAGAEVPTAAERTHDGFLMDPKTDRKTLDFFRCLQEQVVSLAHLMAKTIKRTLPGRLVGIYYGYVMTAQAPEGANVLLDEMLASPDIDFLSNPCHYSEFSRRNGGAYPQRTIPSFYRRRGKLCVMEDDTRFHFVADYGRENCPTETPEETRAVMKRNYLNTVFDGCAIQYCDPTFGGRGKRPYTFDDPDVIAAIRAAKAAIRKAGKVSTDSGNEVLVVVDYRERLRWDSQGSRHHRLAGQLYDATYLALTRSGVPTDLKELRDFLADDLTHTCVIFLNLFGPNTAVREQVRAKLAAKGVTAIWLVAPGCVTPEGFSDAAMSAFAGMKLKGAGHVPNVICEDEAAKAVDGLAGVWMKDAANGGRTVFSKNPIVEPEQWAKLFDTVGVHRYIGPGACIRRQGDIFMLHVGKAGTYRLSLPKEMTAKTVTDLLTDTQYPAGAPEVKSSGPETWFFKVR